MRKSKFSPQQIASILKELITGNLFQIFPERMVLVLLPFISGVLSMQV